MRAAVVLFVVASCGGAARPAPALVPAARATAAPPLAFQLITGEPWTSAETAGRIVVVDVWATWCTPCRHAFPKLNQLAADYPDITVIGLSVDEDDAVVRAFLAEVPATFAIARDPKHSVQEPPLSLIKLPTVLVIDRQGRTRLRAEMVESDYDALPGIVAALRAE